MAQAAKKQKCARLSVGCLRDVARLRSISAAFFAVLSMILAGATRSPQIGSRTKLSCCSFDMCACRIEDPPAAITYHEPKVMAEIGCNHMGSVEIAKELLTLAKEAGCEYAKFQKRCPKELLTKEQYEAPHPNPRNSYGDTYGAHREFLELTVDQHRELLEHCKEIGLGYSCSVWDITSAKEIVSLNPDLIKVRE